MSDQVGRFGGAEPIDVLAAAVLEVNLELDGAEIDADGMVGIVAQKNFERKNSGVDRAGLAELQSVTRPLSLSLCRSLQPQLQDLGQFFD